MRQAAAWRQALQRARHLGNYLLGGLQLCQVHLPVGPTACAAMGTGEALKP